ncbi:MAG: hypothetical protein ACI9J3_004163 [Parvicellaceae bacterium]|jgi:hypothetical protein
MAKLHYISLCAILMFSLFLSCDKAERVTCGATPCLGDCLNDIEIDSLPMGYLPDEYGVHYTDPYYNPLNNSEFIYLKGDWDAGGGSMNIYNMTSSVAIEVINSISFTQGFYRPKMTRSGWIVFGSLTQHVWKVRPDGSNLTQLTFAGNYFNPEVSYTGDTIIAYNITHGSILFDINGSMIDTVLTIGRHSAWSGGNEIAVPYSVPPATEGVGIYDIGNGSLVELINWSFSNGQDDIVDMTWHPNNKDIYHSQWSNGIYKTNKSTGELKLVKVGCYKHFYPAISISNGGFNMLATRLDVDSITPTGALAISQKIVQMQINGCGESVINLP